MTQAALANAAPATDSTAPAAGADPARQARFRLEGMTCASCVLRAERVLTALPGVTRAVVNLSTGPSRLVFPRATATTLPRPAPFNQALAFEAMQRERDLDYIVPSGRYWDEGDRFDVAQIDALDALWLAAATP